MAASRSTGWTLTYALCNLTPTGQEDRQGVRTLIIVAVSTDTKTADAATASSPPPTYTAASDCGGCRPGARLTSSRAVS
jgi:hypothetical protein